MPSEEFPLPHEREPDHSNMLRDLRELAIQGELPPSALPRLMQLEDEERRRAAISPAQCDAWVAEGKRIFRGEGRTPQDREAFILFHHAAVAGHAEAQALVYECYLHEDGVQGDLASFLFWRQKAAESGCAGAQYALGDNYYHARLLVSQDHAQAVKWWTRAAEQGHAMAQNDLGHCYKSGHGVDIDHVEAVKWFRMAAEQGSAAAQYNLGHSLFMGLGVERDYCEAAKWMRMSAEAGDGVGQRNLAFLYENGYGVPKDLQESAKWRRRSEETEASRPKNEPNVPRIVGEVRILRLPRNDDRTP